MIPYETCKNCHEMFIQIGDLRLENERLRAALKTITFQGYEIPRQIAEKALTPLADAAGAVEVRS